MNVSVKNMSEITLISLLFHVCVLYTYRTKIECGGQCMTNNDCGAFHFDQGICKSLRSEGLYVNQGEASPIVVYMLDSDTGIIMMSRFFILTLYNKTKLFINTRLHTK